MIKPPPPKEAIFEWDVLNWSRALDFWRPFISSKPNQTALAVGERNGGLSLWLASNGISTVSSDLEGVTPRARDAHRRYEVTGLIQYKEADITNLPFPDRSFDIVTFKSVLGALRTEELQRQALNELCRVLKDGGVLIFAENLAGSPLHRFFRRKFVRWATYWRYPSMTELGQWLATHGKIVLKSHGFLGAFGRSEKQRRVLARIDGIVSPLIPPTMRYIAFGALRRES